MNTTCLFFVFFFFSPGFWRLGGFEHCVIRKTSLWNERWQNAKDSWLIKILKKKLWLSAQPSTRHSYYPLSGSGEEKVRRMQGLGYVEKNYKILSCGHDIYSQYNHELM